MNTIICLFPDLITYFPSIQGRLANILTYCASSFFRILDFSNFPAQSNLVPLATKTNSPRAENKQDR